MGTRDDEYDYLFKGGSQDQPSFKSCVQKHLSATPVPLSSVNLKTWQLLRIKFNNNCAPFLSAKSKLNRAASGVLRYTDDKTKIQTIFPEYTDQTAKYRPYRDQHTLKEIADKMIYSSENLHGAFW